MYYIFIFFSACNHDNYLLIPALETIFKNNQTEGEHLIIKRKLTPVSHSIQENFDTCVPQHPGKFRHQCPTASRKVSTPVSHSNQGSLDPSVRQQPEKLRPVSHSIQESFDSNVPQLPEELRPVSHSIQERFDPSVRSYLETFDLCPTVTRKASTTVSQSIQESFDPSVPPHPGNTCSKRHGIR